MAVMHHEKLIKEHIKKGAPNKEYDNNELSKINLVQASKLRKSLLTSLTVVFITLLLSLGTSYIFVKYNYLSSQLFILIYLFIGAFTILAVTLWQIGNAETASGEWLHEKVHTWVFKSIYTIGTFFLGLGGGIDVISSMLQP